MAFTIQNWARTSVSMNSDSLTNYTTGVVSPREGGISIYNYYTTDSIATVLASNYFVGTSAANTVKGELAPGDLIYAVCADGQININVVSNNILTPLLVVTTNSVMVSDVAIPAASVAVLNTTPYTIVPAVPVGYKPQLLSLMATVDFNTAAYPTAATLTAQYSGAGAAVSSTIANTLLAVVATSSAIAVPIAVTTTAEAGLAARSITVTASANPGAGDSVVRFRSTYLITKSP